MTAGISETQWIVYDIRISVPALWIGRELNDRIRLEEAVNIRRMRLFEELNKKAGRRACPAFTALRPIVRTTIYFLLGAKLAAAVSSYGVASDHYVVSSHNF
jgi:hypothetical protein